MHQVNLEQVKTQIPLLIREAINGEEVVIIENNEPIARLVSFRQTKPKPQFGSAKGLITISNDFDEPLEDFNEYR